MANHEQLGLTIRTARLDKSMSLGQLASAVGRSSSSVRRWERGEVVPAASVLPKLAAILEIDPQLLQAEAASPQRDSTSSTGESAKDDERVSTVEQPAIEATGSRESVAQGASHTPSSSGGWRSGGLWASLTHRDRGWMGWVRGLLTVAAFVAMLFVMVWAIGELFDALGGVLDSFDVGSNDGQSP